MSYRFPRSLSARIIGLTIMALLVSQLVSFLSFRNQRDAFIEHVVSDYMSQSVLAVNRSLAFAQSGAKGRAVHALSTKFLRFRLVDQPLRCSSDLPTSQRYTQDFAKRLQVPPPRVRVCVGDELQHARTHDGAKTAIALAYRLDDGRWLQARQRLPDRTGHWAHTSLRNVLITTLLMLVVVIVSSRRITRPLRDMARAVERFGRGETVAPVPERGSDEIRRSIAAFNRMRERLARFVAERTRLVAAIAHDLRSPITALRLRLEFLPDDDNTRSMAATLDDMARITEASLDFMREEAAAETTRNVDLSALIDALCEDYRAAGAEIVFEPQDRVTLVCRPVAIKRALRNLIDNALAYGERAEIYLIDGADRVTVEIADDGPGIAQAEMERVFDPFVRLESSRSRETGGTGLGLSIARSVVQGHGGRITLSNRREGGLRVRLWLPRETMERG